MVASLVPVGPARLVPVMGGRLVPVAGGNRDLPPGCCQSGPGWDREAGPGHGREFGPGCQGKPGPAPWSGWSRSWLPVWSRLGPGGWSRSWEGGWARLPGESRTCPQALVVRLVSVACHASLQSWRCMGHKYTQWTREAATPTQMHSLCSIIESRLLGETMTKWPITGGALAEVIASGTPEPWADVMVPRDNQDQNHHLLLTPFE